MSIIYCWSGAGGLGDGTSWTDAYTDLQTALNDNFTMGSDLIWLASDHYETSSGSDNLITWGNTAYFPTHIYSVARGDDSYSPATSAQLEVTSGDDVGVDDACYMYGLYFRGGSEVRLQTYPLYCEDCTFEYGFVSSSGGGVMESLTNGIVKYKNCTFKGDTTLTANSHLRCVGTHFVEGCTFLNRATYLISSYTRGRERFVGTDFSGCTQLSVLSSTNSGAFNQFENCKFPSGEPLDLPGINDYPGNGSLAIGCEVADTSANLYSVWGYRDQTSIDHTTAIYRNDGYMDYETGTRLAHIMEPEFDTVDAEMGLIAKGLFMESYLDTTGSKTFRIEVLHDFTTAPTKDNLWIEVLYHGVAASSELSLAGGRAIYSTDNWPASSVAWTGDAGYSKIKLEQTATIAHPGRYGVRLRFGKFEAGKTLVYCPKVEID